MKKNFKQKCDVYKYLSTYKKLVIPDPKCYIIYYIYQ